MLSKLRSQAWIAVSHTVSRHSVLQSFEKHTENAHKEEDADEEQSNHTHSIVPSQSNGSSVGYPAPDLEWYNEYAHGVS
jgi:hypothetical protein